MKTLQFILDPKNGFEKKVLLLAEKLGMDTAFYLTIGEFQSLCDDNDDDFFLDDENTGKIIDQYPSLEF